MRHLRFRTLLAAVLASACSGSRPAVELQDRAPAQEKRPLRLTLVATNDTHGWVYPQEFTLADGTAAKEGGMAAFAGHLAILRKQNPGGVLLLDGGDLFQGTLPSNLTEGAVVIEAMNHLGYDAAAMGNHEFDYGPVGPSPVALKPDQDPFGALKARLKEAKFPIFAANITEAASGAQPSWLGNDGTVLIERNGVKIGILGLITEQTPMVTNPVNVATLRFNSLAQAAVASADSLRARGATVVIAVAHAGGKCGDLKDPHDLSSCDTGLGEIFTMMAQVPRGTLDAVIAGHTHAPLGHFVNGTPIIETPGMGRSFGLIELALDPEKHTVLGEQTRITPVVPICLEVEQTLQLCDSKKLRNHTGAKMVPATFRGEPVVPDEVLAQKLEPARARAQALQQRSLGLDVPERMVRNYESESALGLLLADALREHEKADIAILNPGGLRADLGQGELTYGDIYEVVPFDNTVSTVTVSGEQLKGLFEAAYGARKGVFQVSGARVHLSRCPGPGRLKNFTLESGKPPRPDQKYRVVMPDFLARGGDGLGPALATLPPEAIDLGLAREDNFRDAIVEQLVTRKAPLSPPKGGRVTFADDAGSCGPGTGTPGHH